MEKEKERKFLQTDGRAGGPIKRPSRTKKGAKRIMHKLNSEQESQDSVRFSAVVKKEQLAKNEKHISTRSPNSSCGLRTIQSVIHSAVKLIKHSLVEIWNNLFSAKDNNEIVSILQWREDREGRFKRINSKSASCNSYKLVRTYCY